MVLLIVLLTIIYYTMNKKKDGEGTLMLDDDTYIGVYKDGLPHGRGKMVYVEGASYDGQWENGKVIRQARAPCV